MLAPSNGQIANFLYRISRLANFQRQEKESEDRTKRWNSMISWEAESRRIVRVCEPWWGPASVYLWGWNAPRWI